MTYFCFKFWNIFNDSEYFLSEEVKNWIRWAGLCWNIKSNDDNIYPYILCGHILYSQCVWQTDEIHQFNAVSSEAAHGRWGVGGWGGLCWGPQQVQSDPRRTQTELQPVSQTTSELRVIFGLMQRQNHKNQRVFPSDILWVLRMALNESLLKRAISLILFPSQIYTPINVQVW